MSKTQRWPPAGVAGQPMREWPCRGTPACFDRFPARLRLPGAVKLLQFLENDLSGQRKEDVFVP